MQARAARAAEAQGRARGVIWQIREVDIQPRCRNAPGFSHVEIAGSVRVRQTRLRDLTSSRAVALCGTSTREELLVTCRKKVTHRMRLRGIEVEPMDTCQADKLVARYPVLLSKPSNSVIAHRGIECGDGWYELVDATLTAIETHCASMGSSLPAITQIKEKFGLLRIYFAPWDEAIRSILDSAEQKSAAVCERCGRPGRLARSPYLHVTCGCDHADGRGRGGLAM